MKIIKGLLLLLITVIYLSSCEERVFDAPPFDIPTFEGKANMTIKDFITKYKGVKDTLRITANDTIEGYVTANDISGNLFKQLVIQDSTAAILINIDQNNICNDYAVGQKVMVTCKDFYIGRTYNMLQLGDYYKNANYNQIGRMNWLFSRNNIHIIGNPDPKVIQPEVITAEDYPKLKDEYNVAKLYMLKGVKYVDGGLKVFATAAEVSGNAVDRVVYFNAKQDSTVTTRNSSYADFANNTLPKGVVNLTGVLTTYNGAPQFMLRSYDDLQNFVGGDGTQELPWDIAYALSKQNGTTKGWIRGYIVGAVAPGITTNNPITGNNDINFTSPFLNNTVVLADSANEKDWTKCIVVELPMGSVLQTQVNLRDNEDNLGKVLEVNGTLQNYLGAGGLTTTGASSDFVLGNIGETSTIYNETFGTTAVQNGTAWPAVADYTGYSKTGAGAAQVTYTADGGAVTLRTNSPSSGYAGASGSVNAMMAASGASLIVNDIATCGATSLSLSFGSNEINDNLAVAYKINGTSNWVPISYTKPSATWGLTSALVINLPLGTNTIKLKFTAAATTFGTRVDDITLTTMDIIGSPVIDPDTGSPQPGGGDGSQTNPYSVAEGITNQGATNTAWVKGYIVGCVKNGVSAVASAADVFIGVTSGFNSATNVLIADNANEMDYTKCIAVNLPAGSALRTSVNLQDNPGNLGKTLTVLGTLRTYFGIAGSRDNTGNDFVLSGSGGGGGTTPGSDILNVPFTTDMGGFTAYSVLGDQTWGLDQYGVSISGFANSQSYQNEDWLISPAMDLTGKLSAALTFDHARGPAASMTVALTNYTLWISTGYTSGAPSTATWTQLTIPTQGTTAWAFVSSGNIAFPPSVLGQTNVRFAFKYTCSNTESATWEIKNVLVK